MAARSGTAQLHGTAGDVQDAGQDRVHAEEREAVEELGGIKFLEIIMIEELWKLLEKFSPEAHQSILEKAEELGLDQKSGIVPLNESYINLTWCSNIIREAVEKNKLIQLPITIQKEMLEIVQTISTSHDQLLAGTNSINALTASIEKLFVDVWRYGLNQLSDEVLGFQIKLNQLKEIEQSVITTKIALEEGIAAKQTLDQIIVEAKGHQQDIQTKAEAVATTLESVTEALTNIENSGDQATASLETINQHKEASAEDLAQIQKNKKEADSDEQIIKELVAEFTKLTEELGANKKTQEELFDEFEKYRVKIDGLLGDASRTGMAASFRTRGAALTAPLWGWLVVFGLSLLGLIYMGVTYIAPLLNSNVATTWEQLPLRLALTAPFIWLGWFSARQYGFTSRLREDYAYKEASANSFEGYKREAKEADVEMLKKLLEQAIKNLGDNPIRIYDGKNNHSSPAHELFDGIMKDDKVLSRLKEFSAIFKP